MNLHTDIPTQSLKYVKFSSKDISTFCLAQMFVENNDHCSFIENTGQKRGRRERKVEMQVQIKLKIHSLWREGKELFLEPPGLGGFSRYGF